jgi:flagellar hook protein FlgE
MMRSLFSAVSGLQNHQLKMDVIGNNIANVNTIGYKASRAYFSEQLAMRLSNAKQSAAGGTTNPEQIGLGVSIGGIDRQFTQGIFQTTGKSTDLALQGDGFFIVGTSDRSYYTRSGNFHFDNQGRLVNSGGYLLKGHMADPSGQLPESTALTDIVMVPDLISPAQATQNVTLSGNLDASATPVKEVWSASKGFTLAATGATAVGTSNLNDLTQTTTPYIDGDTITIAGTDPDGAAVSASFTYGAANDGTTVDDLLAVVNASYTGTIASLDAGKVVLTDDEYGDSATSIILNNDAANTGQISFPIFVNKEEGYSPKVTAATTVFDSLGIAHNLNITYTKTDTPREWIFDISLSGDETVSQGNSGTVTFNSDGTLESILFDRGESSFIFDPNSGADNVTIDIDFGKAGGLTGITNFDGSSTVSIPLQDGKALGTLTSFFIDESGQIVGTFTNGQNRLIAQLGIARFNNPGGLSHLGDNLYEITEGSGSAIVGNAGEDFGTMVVAGALESSTVDLSTEFAEMIIAQRAFQANARVITVSDQFLNEVTQLKR